MADLAGRSAAFGKVKKSKMQNSEDRLRTQTKTFRKWANVHLPASEQFAEGELISGLHDGTRLCALASGLSGRTIKVRPREKIKNKIHMLENLSVGLRALGKMGVDVATIDASMIHDGKINMILGMLWRTVIYTMANDIGGGVGGGGAAAQKGLQQWVKRTCKPMGIKVKNFSSSFRDGKVFGAMIAAVRPDLLTMESLEGVDDRQNIERIFAIAKNELHIPALIDADDLLCSSPDEKSVVTQVAEWFKALSELSQAAASTQSIVDAAACAQRHRGQAVAYETDAVALAAWIAAQRERIGAAGVALDASPAESELWTSAAVRSALDALYSWRAADKATRAATLQQLDAALLVLHSSQRHNERELFEVSDPETASTAALQSAWGELEDLEQAYAAALLARLALCRHTDQTMRFINSIATRARESIDDAAAALAASETLDARAQHHSADAIEEAIAQHRGVVAAAERTQSEIAGIDEYIATLHPMVRSAAEELSSSLVEDSAQLVAATGSKSEALDVELAEEKVRAEKETAYSVEAQQFLREAEAFAADLVAPIPADTLPILEQQLARIREANVEALVARLPTLREQHAVLCEASPAGRAPAPVAAQYDLAVLEKTFRDLESGALQREEELVARCDAQRALVEAAVQDYDDTASMLALWVHETDARLVKTDGTVNAAVHHTHADAVAEAQKEVEDIEEDWRAHRAALDALPFKLAKVAETRETHNLEAFKPELTPTDLGHTWAIVEAKIRSTQATLRDAEFKVNRSAQRADRLRAALDEHDEWVAQQQQMLGLATIEMKLEKVRTLQNADGTATLAGIEDGSDAKAAPTIAAMIVTLNTLQGADDVAVIAELEDGNTAAGVVAISDMIVSLKTLQSTEGIAAIAALEDGGETNGLATISSMIATLETVQGTSDIAVLAGLQDGGEVKGAPTIATMIATLRTLQVADDIAVVAALQEEGGDAAEGTVAISVMLTTLRALQGSGGTAVVQALEDGGAENGEATIASMITSLDTLHGADDMATVSGLQEECGEVEGVTTISTMITTLQSLEGDAPTAAALRMCTTTTTRVGEEGETESLTSGAVHLEGLATIANMIETLELLQDDSDVRAALQSSAAMINADEEDDDGDEIAIDLEGDESADAIVGAIADADGSEATFGRGRSSGESDEPTLAACESELRAIAAFEQKMKRREQLFPVDATLAARIAETKERYEATAELAREKASALVKQIEFGTARAQAARKVSEEAEALLDDIDVLGEHLEEPMWAGDAISRIEARRVETEEVLATELPKRAERLAKLRLQCTDEAADDDSALASIVQAEERLETARAKARELVDALGAQLSSERAKAEEALTDGVAEVRAIAKVTDQWLDDGERDFLPGKERSDAKLLLAREMHAKQLINADELEDIAERLMRPAVLLAPRGDEHALIFRSSGEAAAAKAKLDAWVGRTDERQAAMHVMRQIPRRVDAARERHDDIASFAESEEAIDFAPGHRLSPGALQTRFDEIQAGVDSYAELLAYATRELAVADHSANIIASRSAKLTAWCERCSADATGAAAGVAVGHTPASTDSELLGCRLLLARLETRAKAAEGVATLHESIDPTYFRHDEMESLATETSNSIEECTRAVGESIATIEGVLAINSELKMLDGAYLTDAESLLASIDGVEQLAAEAMIELDGGEDAASIPVIERTLASLEYALESQVSEWQPQEEALAEKFTQMSALVEASDAQQDFDPHSALAGRYTGSELGDRSAAARASLEKARDDAIALLSVLSVSAERVWTEGRAEYADVFGDLTDWIEESGAKFDALDVNEDAEVVDAELKRWAADEMAERRVQLHSLASIVHGINGHMQRHERDHYIPDELVVIEVVEQKWEDLLKKTSHIRAEVAKRQLVTERNAFVLNSIDEKRGLVLTWVDEQEALLIEETKTDGKPKRRGRRASLVALRDYVAATEAVVTEEKTTLEENEVQAVDAEGDAAVQVGADAEEEDAALQSLSQVDALPDGVPPPRPPAADKRLRRNSLELAKQGLLTPVNIDSTAAADADDADADAEGGDAGSVAVSESNEAATETPVGATDEVAKEVTEEASGASGQVQAAIAKIEEAQKRAAAEKEAAAPSPMELAAGRMAILETQISRCALAEQQHGQFLAMVADAEISQTALAGRLAEVSVSSRFRALPTTDLSPSAYPPPLAVFHSRTGWR